MVTSIVLAGILFPIAIYLGIAAIVFFVLGCASYVCIVAFRQHVNKSYRKLKLRYWREQTFDFLGLPPQIRLMVYRYSLPPDQIYYMTARKDRFYGSPPHEDLKDEIVPQPLSLLRVCRLVYEELWPLIYKQCIFYITIYSIRDLLYAANVLDHYTDLYDPDYATDIFAYTSNIRVRVNDLMLDVHPLYQGRRGWLFMEMSQTAPLWVGRGAKTILKNRTQAATTARTYFRGKVAQESAGHLKVSMLHMTRLSVLDKSSLNKMLPWYQRYQRQRPHKWSTSPV